MTEIFITASRLVASPSRGTEWLLQGLVSRGSLGMIHAGTGVGKTYFATWMAICVATGTDFFRFRCPKPSRVCLVDGEMFKEHMRQRISLFAAGLEREEPSDDYLKIVTPDLCVGGVVPNMADSTDRTRYSPAINDADLVIFDNLLSCSWGTTAREDEIAAWQSIQRWLIALRSKGKAIVIVHHSNKTRTGQLGTSQREHAMDWILQLRRPADYEMSQGARFWASFDKARHLFGDDPSPLSIQLKSDESKAWWEWSKLETEIAHSIDKMNAIGMNPKEIACALGVSIYEVKKQLKNDASTGGNNGTKEVAW